MKGIKKILVRAPNWIGDAVLSLPAVEALKRLYPEAEIAILARQWVADVFANIPHIDRVIYYDKKGGIRNIYRLVKGLRDEDFDMAILFQNGFEAALIAWLSRIPIRVGYSTNMRGVLLTHPIKKPEVRNQKSGMRHQVFYYMDLLEGLKDRGQGLGVRGQEQIGDKRLTPRLYITDEERKWARDFLNSQLTTHNSQLVIGINPGASYGEAKRWDLKRFAMVAKGLIEKLNGSVIIFGSRKERWIGEEMIRIIDSPAVLNLMGDTYLRASIALISRCSLFLTNDTGPMHIASALGVPVVAIFGSTDPVVTGPLGDKSIVLRKEIECAPCFKRKCPLKHHRCMDLIGEDEVINASIKSSIS